MNAVLHETPIRRTRSASNEQFANDGSYESVERMLFKLAGTCYNRVRKLGLPMEHDDVMQELRLSYVKAKAAWRPEGGALFSTYCRTACQNNFNNYIDKMATERRELGLMLISDMGEQQFDGVDLTRPAMGSQEYAREGQVLLHPDTNDDDRATESPEEIMARRQDVQNRLKRLTPNARALVDALVRQSTQKDAPDLRLSQIADMLNLSPVEFRRVRQEIAATLG